MREENVHVIQNDDKVYNCRIGTDTRSTTRVSEFLELSMNFVDCSFGADTTDEKTAGATWLRASELRGVKHNPKLYCNVEPNDIEQGQIGDDCWLMTAIASVAEFPLFIQENLIITPGLSPDGKVGGSGWVCGCGWAWSVCGCTHS